MAGEDHEQRADVVPIRPGVGILSVLAHLNYKSWFAVAEFVDNSIQSFLTHTEALRALHGDTFKLRVEINFSSSDGGVLTVRDNAAGIAAADLPRAFRTADRPPDRNGLAEFGVGMKSAACWFAAEWSVRTSALGEPTERTVTIDVAAVVRESTEFAAVKTVECAEAIHFTELTLRRLHKIPQTRTVTKIKTHLASIYRMFLRRGDIEILFDGEALEYHDPAILNAPYFREPDAGAVLWRKDIVLDFGRGMSARGFAAIRQRGSTAGAGFALFRRGRLIEGSGDEGWRPPEVFGQSNSYTYQRLFGELQLEGFEVSHTKDGFRWDDHEEIFLAYLQEELDAPPLRLRDQAEGFRVRSSRDEVVGGAEQATTRTAAVIAAAASVIDGQLAQTVDSEPPPEQLPVVELVANREIDLTLRGITWRVILQLSNDPSISEWISIFDSAPSDLSARIVGVRLSLAHPFSVRFGGTTADRVEPLVRIAAALALAETVARSAGVHGAPTIRRHFNELLRECLGAP